MSAPLSAAVRARQLSAHPDAWVRAAARAAFDLTYRRAATPRALSQTMIAGDSIDDAHHPGRESAGEWDNGPVFPASGASEDQWIDHYASMAISEAAHEALEWFQVDGAPWLDPHGPKEDAIYACVTELTDRLAALRAEPSGTPTKSEMTR